MLSEEGQQRFEVFHLVMLVRALQDRHERLAAHPGIFLRIEQIVFGDGACQFQEALEAHLPVLMHLRPGFLVIALINPGIDLIRRKWFVEKNSAGRR